MRFFFFFSQKITLLINGHAADKGAAEVSTVVGENNEDKVGRIGFIAGVIRAIQSGVTDTCLCQNQGLITFLTPKPSVVFHTCLLIFQSVLCLHNAFLRCLPHNKEECQHRF